MKTENDNMKSLPEDDRPYEKIERHGVKTLTDRELLAVIIKTGTKSKNAVSVAGDLLKGCNGKLAEMRDKSIQELMKTDGIGRVKAIQILAACELASRLCCDFSPYGQKISGSADIGAYLVKEMGYLKHEIFKTVLLDVHLKIIKTVDVSVGTIDKTIVHPREVFKEAIRCSCSKVIAAHNHPGGDLTASREDIITTRRIAEAGEIIGIDVLDHIIVAGNEYISMKEQGIFPGT